VSAQHLWAENKSPTDSAALLVRVRVTLAMCLLAKTHDEVIGQM